MFIRTSLSIVFLKCSASSVPVGHGGTNSLWPLRSPGGSGSFCFLRLSCQTAFRLRLCRRPHATAFFWRSRSHLFIFAPLVSLSRGDGVCRELGEACEAVWGGRDLQREPLSVMRCEPRTPRRAGERGSDCSLRTEASFASTLSVNLEVCPHCSSALKRLHHPPKMARVNS